MAEYLELDYELTTLGPDGMKLHELGVLEAIAREKSVIREPEDVVRFSVRATAELIDEYDIIEDEVDHSHTGIMSGSTLHGLSIIWDLYEDAITEIEAARIHLLRSDDPAIYRIVSSTNRSTFVVRGHLTAKTITLPIWSTGHAANIAKTLFMRPSTVYQVCMAHSLWTREIISPSRRKNLQDIMETFAEHVAAQSALFTAVETQKAKPKVDKLGCVKRYARFESTWNNRGQEVNIE